MDWRAGRGLAGLLLKVQWMVAKSLSNAPFFGNPREWSDSPCEYQETLWFQPELQSSARGIWSNSRALLKWLRVLLWFPFNYPLWLFQKLPSQNGTLPSEGSYAAIVRSLLATTAGMQTGAETVWETRGLSHSLQTFWLALVQNLVLLAPPEVTVLFQIFC